MKRGLFVDSPPFTMFVMLGFAMVTCYLLFFFIGLLLAPVILDIPIDELMNVINKGDADNQLNVIRYMQVLFSISIFTIPAFFAAYLFSKNAVSYLGLRQGAPIKWFAVTLVIMLAVIPFINLLVALNEMIVFPESLAGLEQRLKSIEENARETTRLILNVDNVSGMFFNLFMIAMLPAIGEELIFRGLLHKIFFKWTGNIHVTIIVTGFLFSILHIQFYGLFPRWLLGVMFGYMMVWSGTIWLPIFAHFTNNAIAVYISYLIHKGTISEKFEVFGATPSDIPVTIATTSVCLALVWIMCRKWQEKNSRKLFVP